MTRTSIREAIDTWLMKRYRGYSLDAILSPMHLAALYRCCEYAAEHGDWPSIKWLAQDLGLEHRTAMVRLIDKLSASGLITKTRGRHPALPCKISVPLFRLKKTFSLALDQSHENTDIPLPLPRSEPACCSPQDAGGDI